jgi:N-acetylneuraminic acid mutarotase
MLKKISAALIAASMLAAPAMAGTKTETAPITKPVAPEAKLQANKLQVKPSVRHANAAMTHHHYRYHRHHRSHLSANKAGKVSAYKANKISAHKTGRLSAYKTSKVSKVTIKQPGAATRRG